MNSSATNPVTPAPTTAVTVIERALPLRSLRSGSQAAAPVQRAWYERLLRRSVGWMLRHPRGRRLSRLATNLAFAALPFRSLFLLSVRFRRKSRSDGLVEHFAFFCGRDCGSHADWITTDPTVARYASESFVYLMLNDNDPLALSLLPKIDWRALSLPKSDLAYRLITRYTTGYRTPFIAQLHTVVWHDLDGMVYVAFLDLLTLMIEHRIFEYEDRIFRDWLFDQGCKAEAVPLDSYVAAFFQDAQLVAAIFDRLGLGDPTAKIAERQAVGKCLERFSSYSDTVFLTEVIQFYAYRHLLLHTYHAGSGHLVGPIWLASLKTQSILRQQMPRPTRELQRALDQRAVSLPEVALLSPDWSALIGHNGHLAVHLQMRDMGWWKGTPVLLAYKGRIANRPFLSLFDDLCHVLYRGENISEDAWDELACLTPFIGTSHQAFAFEDGRAMYWNDAGAMAVHAWEGANRGFPLRDVYDARHADGAADEEMARMKAAWGMRDTDWFVCLHMRDSAARGETVGAGESIRSATFDHYADAIRFVLDQGGWVVRMGSPKVAPMPDMPRLVDYARSPFQTPLMDIHLVRRARMFIGTTSGFAYVASNFGVPTAMVNAISSVGLLWSKNTRFALKPVGLRNGRLLTQREATSEQWRWAFPTHESMTEAGLIVADSSADEIMETVKETLAIADQDGTPVETPLLARWRRSLSIETFYGAATPSQYFLEKYEGHFLDD